MNRILAQVRAGGPRTNDSFSETCVEIMKAWNDIMNGGEKGRGDRELKVISMMGSISAGIESGFLLPQVSTLSVRLELEKSTNMLTLLVCD